MIKKNKYKTPFYNDPEKREKHKENMKKQMKEYRKKKEIQEKIKKYRKEYFRRPEVRKRINESRRRKITPFEKLNNSDDEH